MTVPIPWCFAALITLPTFWKPSEQKSTLLIFCTALWLFALILLSDKSPLGIFISLVSLFHLGEFLMTWKFHASADFSSFLLTNGKLYNIFMLLAMVEHNLISCTKIELVTALLGLLMACFGLLLRWMGMITAGPNFTHKVAQTRTENHNLVTYGIYSVCRHPGYAGWFWWTVGLQILLGNRFCLVVFTLTSWLFFFDRIENEDFLLEEFFGQKFTNYKSQTPSWIPGLD